MQRESRAPLIVAFVLLLLPALYVGSYLALVVPEGFKQREVGFDHPVKRCYRLGGDYAERFFRPLERIDQRIRPNAWGDNLPLVESEEFGHSP